MEHRAIPALEHTASGLSGIFHLLVCQDLGSYQLGSQQAHQWLRRWLGGQSIYTASTHSEILLMERGLSI